MPQWEQRLTVQANHPVGIKSQNYIKRLPLTVIQAIIWPVFRFTAINWQTYFTNKRDNLLLCIFDSHFNQPFLFLRSLFATIPRAEKKSGVFHDIHVF